jgi:hypothetical protein
VTRFVCPVCQSVGFFPSVTGKGCTFCDGTENGECPYCQRLMTAKERERGLCEVCQLTRPKGQ